jgi:outer membrane protein assembly factor BamD (BamD/ComL family)
VLMPVPIPAPAPTLAPAPVAVARERPVARAHAHVAAPVREEVPANRLAEETALLAASNAELRNGDARGALALLNDYDRRYPSGVLREEVLATRVIARCQLGPEPDTTARHAADAFLTRHPASPLAPRVRSSCAR